MERCEISGDLTGKFTFITEDGTEKLGYLEYLGREDLAKKVRDETRIKLILGRTIISYPREFLSNRKIREELEATMQEYDVNRLRFFMPSGPEATAFLNDWKKSLILEYGPNQSGKSTHAFVKMLLKSLPLDPSWELFTENGVKYQTWEGPKRIGIATYQSSHLRNVIWPQLLRKWIPHSELGKYVKMDPNWNQPTPSVLTTCGTEFFLFTYEQRQEVFESMVLDAWMWDEQGYEEMFDGANERVRTRNGWHVFSLTPHPIPGRSDTGAGGWIDKLWRGDMTKGHTIGRYQLKFKYVPDWVYPESQKVAAWKQHILEPMEQHNAKKLRIGRARVLGEPASSSGLIFDDWSRPHHLIDPFPIPKSWPRWRSADHGNQQPTVCIYWTITPEGIRVIYDLYYVGGLPATIHAKNIIERSGNRRKYMGSSKVGGDDGSFIRKYQEIMCNAYFERSVLDSRCLNKPTPMAESIGDLYIRGGLRFQPASGMDFKHSRSFVDELLVVDDNKIHPWTGKKGCPGVVVFRNLHELIEEIENLTGRPVRNRSANLEAGTVDVEPDPSKKQHAIDALRYGAQVPMRFHLIDVSRMPGAEDDEDEQDARNRAPVKRDPYTNY